MRIKIILVFLLISGIALIGKSEDQEVLRLRKKVLRLERENVILKQSWDSCLKEYEKMMVGG